MNQHRRAVLWAIALTIAAGGLSTTGAAAAAPAPASVRADATPLGWGSGAPRAEGTVSRLSAHRASPRVERVSGSATPDSRVRLQVDRPGSGTDVAVVKTSSSGRFTMRYPRITRAGRYVVTATFVASARYTSAPPSITSFRIL